MPKPKWPKRGMLFKLFLYVGWEAAAISFLLMLGTFALPLFESQPRAFSDKATLASTNAVVVTGTNRIVIPSPTSINYLSPRLLMVLIFIIVCLIASISGIYKAHLKRAYDSALILHFEKDFEEMAEQRGKAAAVLLLYSKLHEWDKIPSADDIEPILDFLDNLGFYLYGTQLSERVIHQSFCHWICLYYQEGNAYVSARREGAEGERSTWEHVEYLVQEVFAIEAAKQGCLPQDLKLNPRKYRKYLLEEFEEGDSDFKTAFMKAYPDIFVQDATGTQKA